MENEQEQTSAVGTYPGVPAEIEGVPIDAKCPNCGNQLSWVLHEQASDEMLCGSCGYASTPRAESERGEQELKTKAAQVAVLFAFMGWLTGRKKESGPFGATNEVPPAVELIEEFCLAQGWPVKGPWDAKWDSEVTAAMTALGGKYPPF